MRVTVHREATSLLLPAASSTAKLSTPAVENAGETSDSNNYNTINRDPEASDVEHVNMANGIVVAVLGWLIWAFITGLNVYLIVMLALGQG